jgi:hypothetical protein
MAHEEDALGYDDHVDPAAYLDDAAAEVDAVDVDVVMQQVAEQYFEGRAEFNDLRGHVIDAALAVERSLDFVIEWHLGLSTGAAAFEELILDSMTMGRKRELVESIVKRLGLFDEYKEALEIIRRLVDLPNWLAHGSIDIDGETIIVRRGTKRRPYRREDFETAARDARSVGLRLGQLMREVAVRRNALDKADREQVEIREIEARGLGAFDLDS